ncbi:MAG: hypothetical protein NT173_07715 [Opitutales bacterium]|nr:hypothetical protein [Opitutales bacterium]
MKGHLFEPAGSAAVGDISKLRKLTASSLDNFQLDFAFYCSVIAVVFGAHLLPTISSSMDLDVEILAPVLQFALVLPLGIIASQVERSRGRSSRNLSQTRLVWGCTLVLSGVSLGALVLGRLTHSLGVPMDEYFGSFPTFISAFTVNLAYGFIFAYRIWRY